jgi:16S rRNA (cytidine1402-2'-O)-methyltransferase
MTGTLYLVGTPIGNLGDLSERASSTLASVGLVAAEDTRRTGRLLAGLGVRVRLVSFFEGNESERLPELLEALGRGIDVAVVSDAGMPGISDPGYRLVTTCLEAGVAVDVVPGPSAVLGALVISGLPTDRFAFDGFLPRGGRSRADRIRELASETRTVVLFESPRRVVSTLEELLDACGDRRVAVVRELTKLHQEVVRGRLREVADTLRPRALKGEVVIVLEGEVRRRPAAADPGGMEAIAVAIAGELVSDGMRKRDAARRAGRATGVPSRWIYDALIRSTAERRT